MAEESKFVSVALNVAKQVLRAPLSVLRGAALLYEIRIDNKLDVIVDPKKPVRGDSAFQTDLCVFEEHSDGISIPRVVLEFKGNVHTHDVLTYSAKARKHKQVYPYLRYGLVAEGAATVPRRFFIHNEALDFFAAVPDPKATTFQDSFSRLLKAEVKASRRLESIALGSSHPSLFRTEVQLDAL